MIIEVDLKTKSLQTWATRYFRQAHDLLKTSGYDDAAALKYIQDFCEKYHSKYRKDWHENH